MKGMSIIIKNNMANTALLRLICNRRDVSITNTGSESTPPPMVLAVGVGSWARTAQSKNDEDLKDRNFALPRGTRL